MATIFTPSTTRKEGFEGEGYAASDCNLQITNAYGAARGADIEGDVNFITHSYFLIPTDKLVLLDEVGVKVEDHNFDRSIYKMYFII